MDFVHVRDNKRNEAEDQQRSFANFVRGEENKHSRFFYQNFCTQKVKNLLGICDAREHRNV